MNSDCRDVDATTPATTTVGRTGRETLTALSPHTPDSSHSRAVGGVYGGEELSMSSALTWDLCFILGMWDGGLTPKSVSKHLTILALKLVCGVQGH
jgi:hypothetical protein